MYGAVAERLDENHPAQVWREALEQGSILREC
jgi:hypothetical protein